MSAFFTYISTMLKCNRIASFNSVSYSIIEAILNVYEINTNNLRECSAYYGRLLAVDERFGQEYCKTYLSANTYLDIFEILLSLFQNRNKVMGSFLSRLVVLIEPRDSWGFFLYYESLKQFRHFYSANQSNQNRQWKVNRIDAFSGRFADCHYIYPRRAEEQPAFINKSIGVQGLPCINTVILNKTDGQVALIDSQSFVNKRPLLLRMLGFSQKLHL